VNPVIGPVNGNESLAQIAECGFVRVSDLRLGQHHSHLPALSVDDLTVLDLVLHLADGVRARRSAADPGLGLLAHFDLGDQTARRWIPAGEFDAGGFADQTAASVAADEILRPQALAVGYLNIDAGFVLREAGDLTRTVELHRQLDDPAGEDALDVLLPEAEAVGVPGREVADVQFDAAESRDLRLLTLGNESIDDSALIENLEGARVQSTRARAGQILVGTTLDDRDVDSRQRQLARQHQSRRTATDDHHRMFGHPKSWFEMIAKFELGGGTCRKPGGA